MTSAKAECRYFLSSRSKEESQSVCLIIMSLSRFSTCNNTILSEYKKNGQCVKISKTKGDFRKILSLYVTKFEGGAVNKEVISVLLKSILRRFLNF